MAKMKVDYNISWAKSGEPKNKYWGLTLGRVKRMMRGKGMVISRSGSSCYSIHRDGEYIGAFYPAHKDLPSRLYHWPLGWKK